MVDKLPNQNFLSNAGYKGTFHYFKIYSFLSFRYLFCMFFVSTTGSKSRDLLHDSNGILVLLALTIINAVSCWFFSTDWIGPYDRVVCGEFSGKFHSQIFNLHKKRHFYVFNTVYSWNAPSFPYTSIHHCIGLENTSTRYESSQVPKHISNEQIHILFIQMTKERKKTCSSHSCLINKLDIHKYLLLFHRVNTLNIVKFSNGIVVMHFKLKTYQPLNLLANENAHKT